MFKKPQLSDYVSSAEEKIVDLCRNSKDSHSEEAEASKSSCPNAEETPQRDESLPPGGATSRTSTVSIIEETMSLAVKKKTIIEEPGTATSKTADNRPKQYFVIHNSWSNKVLDVTEDDTSPGAYLIIYQLKTPFSDNQLWYKDQNDYICSKLTGYYIDTSKDGYARLKPRGEANVKQHWVYHEDDRTIRNEHDKNKVLDIRWDIKWSCNKVIEYDFHDGRNQKWELRKVDIQ